MLEKKWWYKLRDPFLDRAKQFLQIVDILLEISRIPYNIILNSSSMLSQTTLTYIMCQIFLWVCVPISVVARHVSISFISFWTAPVHILVHVACWSLKIRIFRVHWLEVCCAGSCMNSPDQLLVQVGQFILIHTAGDGLHQCVEQVPAICIHMMSSPPQYLKQKSETLSSDK